MKEVVFKDPAFEAKVRIAMEKPTGDIITDFSPLAGIFDKLQGKDFELG
jgi:hypothetical protein